MVKLRPTFCAAIFALLPFLTACGPSSDDIWARQVIANRVQERAMIVDVRTPEEYRAGHIKTAVNIPYDQVEDRLNEFGDDKDLPIAVYCGHGGRAEYAKQALDKHGYRNVLNLGGYPNLAQTGLVE
jgi:phage shock protein E